MERRRNLSNFRQENVPVPLPPVRTNKLNYAAKRVGIRGKEAEADSFGEDTAGEEKSGGGHAAVNGRDWL